MTNSTFQKLIDSEDKNFCESLPKTPRTSEQGNSASRFAALASSVDLWIELSQVTHYYHAL